jgi:hypothetical protein
LQYTDLDLVVVEDRMWLHTVNHAWGKANGAKVSEDDVIACSPRFSEELLATENTKMSPTYGI